MKIILDSILAQKIAYVEVFFGSVIASVLYLSGLIVGQIQSMSTDDVLGPLGALVLALIVAGLLFRHLMKSRRELELLNKRLLDDKDKTIEARDKEIQEIKDLYQQTLDNYNKLVQEIVKNGITDTES